MQNLSDASYVNILSFGAVGDDSTDCTTAIATALDTIGQSDGGVIYFPPGIYIVSESIKILFDNIKLVGDDKHTTIIKYTYQQVIRDANYVSEKNNSLFVTADNGYINNFSIVNISLQYAGDYDIKNPDAYYSHGYGAICGIFIKRVNNLLLDNIQVSGFNRSGLLFDEINMPPNYGDSTNVKITGSIFRDCHYANVEVRNVDGFLFNNNFVYNAGSNLPENMLGVTGYGLTFETYNLNYSRNIVITNNKFYRNSRKGVDSHGADNIIVDANIFSENGSVDIGLYIKTGSVVISNNILEKHGIIPIISGKPTTLFAAIELSHNSDTVTDSSVSYNIKVANNIIKDIDVKSGLPFNAIVCFADVKKLHLNLTNNTIAAKNLDRVVQIKKSTPDTGDNYENTLLIDGNIITVEEYCRIAGFEIQGIEKAIILNNAVNINKQGVRLDGQTSPGNNPFLFLDINSNGVKQLIFNANNVKGNSWNGQPFATVPDAVFVPVTDLSNGTTLVKDQKMIIDTNWLNTDKRAVITSTESYGLTGNAYQNNVFRILNPPTGTVRYTAAAVPGAIAIRLPNPILNAGLTDDKFIQIQFSVFNNSGDANYANNGMTVKVSGRLFKNTGTDPDWRSPQVAIVDQSRDFIKRTIRFAYDTNGYPYILLGNDTDSWNAPFISIDSVSLTLGTEQAAIYKTGYVVTILSNTTALLIKRTVEVMPNQKVLSGTTAQRPSAGALLPGVIYFDTDLGKSIVWNGATWNIPESSPQQIINNNAIPDVSTLTSSYLNTSYPNAVIQSSVLFTNITGTPGSVAVCTKFNTTTWYLSSCNKI